MVSVFDGPLLERPKRGEKAAKGTPLGIPDSLRGFPLVLGLLFAARGHRIGESFAPLTRLCGEHIESLPLLWSALYRCAFCFEAPPLGGALRPESAQIDRWGRNPAPRCVKTIHAGRLKPKRFQRRFTRPQAGAYEGNRQRRLLGRVCLLSRRGESRPSETDTDCK